MRDMHCLPNNRNLIILPLSMLLLRFLYRKVIFLSIVVIFRLLLLVLLSVLLPLFLSEQDTSPHPGPTRSC